MKNTVIIDANIIVRFITKSPKEQYHEVLGFFDKLAMRKVRAVLFESILMECYFVLSKFYNIDKQKVISKLKTILEFENIINEDKYIMIETLNLLKEKNIDFVDALICTKSTLLGYKVFSFDKDIKKCTDREY